MQRLYIERFYLNRADDECFKLGVERDADGSEHYVYHDNPRLHQQGLTYEIPDRHPLQIAPIADYRNAKPK